LSLLPPNRDSCRVKGSKNIVWPTGAGEGPPSDVCESQVMSDDDPAPRWSRQNTEDVVPFGRRPPYTQAIRRLGGFEAQGCGVRVMLWS
jgi:hypothetical protein